MVRYYCRLSVLSGLLALIVLSAHAKAGRLASAATAQQDPQPSLELETANGEAVAWLFQPEADLWLPLTLPPALDAAQLEDAEVVSDPVLTTLVDAEGVAVAVYRPAADGGTGVLEAVPEGYARLEDGQWVRWSGSAWKASGPPAGDEHPLSWAVQEYVNENLPELRLQYVTALTRGGNMQRFALSDGEDRYAVAVALVATERRGTVKNVPLLVQLGTGNYEVAEARSLVRNSQTDWTSTKRAAVRNEFSSVEYRTEPIFVASGDPLLRRTPEGTFFLDWDGDDEWNAISTNGNWHARSMVDILINVDVASVDDIRASFDLTQEEAIVARTTDAMEPLVTTTAGLDSNRRCEIPEEWQEQAGQQFVLIHSEADAELATALLTDVIPDLEADYAQFSRLFDTSLSAPISIRIYPERDVYRCLNVVAPEMPPGRFHSHIGEREIVLLGSDLDPIEDAWQEAVLNALRYEVAVLFADQVSDGAALAGLQAGIGAYAQDPQYILNTAEATSREPRLDWRFLWEEEVVGHSAVVAREAMTTVAYLVEGRGWPAFRQFLAALGEANNYRQALANTYGTEAATLQAEWRRYHPLYFSERWHSNVFYGFDLAIYEMLLEAGAYEDADASLQEAIAFLETVDAEAAIAEARDLLEKAEQGQEAAELVRQARRALQDGQYEEAIGLADEAEALYEALGDSRRLEEIEVYRSRAEEIIRLQEELAQLTVARAEGDSETVTRLQDVGQRLAALGEVRGAAEAEATLQQMEAQQRARVQMRAERILLAVAVLLLLRGLWLLRRRPAEAGLL